MRSAKEWMSPRYVERFTEVYDALSLCQALPPSVYRFKRLCEGVTRGIELTGSRRQDNGDLSSIGWFRLYFELLLQNPRLNEAEDGCFHFTVLEREIMAASFKEMLKHLVSWAGRFYNLGKSEIEKGGLDVLVFSRVRAALNGLGEYRTHPVTVEDLLFDKSEDGTSFDYSTRIVDLILTKLRPAETEFREWMNQRQFDDDEELEYAKLRCHTAWLKKFETERIPLAQGIRVLKEKAEKWQSGPRKRQWDDLWYKFNTCNFDDPWMTPDDCAALEEVKSLYNALTGTAPSRASAEPSRTERVEDHEALHKAIHDLSLTSADSFHSERAEELTKLLSICLKKKTWGIWGNPVFISALTDLATTMPKYNVKTSLTYLHERERHSAIIRVSAVFAAFYRAFLKAVYPEDPKRSRPEWVVEGNRVIDAVKPEGELATKHPLDYYAGLRQLGAKIAATLFDDEEIDLMYAGIFPDSYSKYQIPSLDEGNGSASQSPTVESKASGSRFDVSEEKSYSIYKDKIFSASYRISKGESAKAVIDDLLRYYNDGVEIQWQSDWKKVKGKFMRGDAKRFAEDQILHERQLNPFGVETKKYSGRWRLRTDGEVMEMKKSAKRKVK